MQTALPLFSQVQDMLDPEVYAGAYRRAGGGWATSKYSDQAVEALDERTEVLPWQRQPLYCVRVPGEAAWVAGDSASPASGAGSSSSARAVPGHTCCVAYWSLPKVQPLAVRGI